MSLDVPKLGDAHAANHPCDVQENVVYQTRLPSSIAPWSSSGAHVLIVEAFGGGQESGPTKNCHDQGIISVTHFT